MISKWRVLLLRFYAPLAKVFRPGEAWTGLLWAVVVGALGGLGAIGFRKCIEVVLWVWTRRTGSLEEVAAQLAWWQRLIIPAAGGLTAGLMLQVGAKMRRGHRSTDYMEAVAVERGVIPLRGSLAKTFSSVLTIGSGGSIGREGAMVQLSATVASLFGRVLKLSTPRLRLLVACGAVGGLAAVYNVTVAAALFVAEIVLGSIATESFGPLLAAAVASSFVSRYLGKEPAYFTRPSFELASPAEIITYLLMGVALGAVAPGYVWLLRRAEELLAKLAPSVYWRLALGGLIVGALAVPFPEVWGNGRTMVNLVLSNPWPAGLLSLILLCKVAATASTTGSGAVGGVFTPTMFTGAMIGCLCGHGFAAVWPGPIANPSAYALVGMAGFLAAATRAPLMAITMVLEMTLNYGVVLPLVTVSVAGYFTARALHSDSIYSEHLRRKQPRTAPADISALRVRNVMKVPIATVLENASLEEVTRHFANAPYHHLLVVTLNNRLRGTISLKDVENIFERQRSPDMNAASLMQPVVMTMPDMPLSDALAAFHECQSERLPVVSSSEDPQLVGSISKTDVLLSLAHGIQGSSH